MTVPSSTLQTCRHEDYGVRGGTDYSWLYKRKPSKNNVLRCLRMSHMNVYGSKQINFIYCTMRKRYDVFRYNIGRLYLHTIFSIYA